MSFDIQLLVGHVVIRHVDGVVIFCGRRTEWSPNESDAGSATAGRGPTDDDEEEEEKCASQSGCAAVGARCTLRRA
jgi:hypothetical protein